MRIRGAGFGALVVVALFAGCTSTSVASPPSPSATPITVTSSTTLNAPKGSRSADLTVTCVGSFVTLTVDNEAEPRLVTCGTVRTMTVRSGQRLDLRFEPVSGSTYSATVRFSSAAFRSDAALAAQCNALGTALSDIISADNGLGEGAITATQAQVLVAQAAQALQGVSASGVAGKDLAALRTWLTNNPTADPRTAPTPPTASQPCVDNESPIVYVSQYGG